MNGLTLSDFKTLSPLFGEDVYQVFDFEASVERRAAIGGTSKKMVERQIDILRRFLEDHN
jgi:argininosuccinate lyase